MKKQIVLTLLITVAAIGVFYGTVKSQQKQNDIPVKIYGTPVAVEDIPVVEIEPEVDADEELTEENIDTDNTVTVADDNIEEEEEVASPISNETLVAEAETILEQYEVNLPDDVRAYCEDIGSQYQICPELLEAIAWRESRFQSTAINGDCTGIMQVSYQWHANRMAKVGAVSLTNTRDCILVAADYLSELFEENGLVKSLMLYNGDARANEIGYVSSYASDILTVSEALERVHGY